MRLLLWRQQRMLENVSGKWHTMRQCDIHKDTGTGMRIYRKFPNFMKYCAPWFSGCFEILLPIFTHLYMRHNAIHKDTGTWPTLKISFEFINVMPKTHPPSHLKYYSTKQRLLNKVLQYDALLIHSDVMDWYMWCDLGELVGSQTCDIEVLIRRGTCCWKPHLNRTSCSKVIAIERFSKQ